MIINKIVIVGAGSAGWMSAAFLKRSYPEKEIVVIESPDVPTVGVGESTLGDITNFRDYLGLTPEEEKEFVRACDASFKMSIKFTDFYEVDSGSFHYPFRFPDLSDPLLTPRTWMEVKAAYPEIPVQDFTRCFFPHSSLYETNRFLENVGNYKKKTDVAYHFDATKFGNWLRDNYCIPRGVIKISDTVEEFFVDESGITGLLTSKGLDIKADLYVDCTGFSSIILDKVLKEPFVSYTHLLPNNRAWAVQVPYIDKEKELEPYTNCTAIGHGWCWNIPLWSRLGTGYVYSDLHITPEEAKEEYKKYLMSDKMIIPRTKEQVESLQFKDIKMRVGIHERTFVKNVVAIGLSAGFIEPLESNGLLTVQRFLTELAKVLQRPKLTQWDRDTYNYATKQFFKSFAEFVALHYALSIRDDTKYWKSISEKSFSPALLTDSQLLSDDLQKVGAYKHMRQDFPTIAPETYITIGMNYPLYDKIAQKYLNQNGVNMRRIDKIKSMFETRKKYWEKSCQGAPSLYEYLKTNYYN